MTFAAALRSSVGKKYLMGITGLIWVGFTIGHLIGNYLIFAGRNPFNEYAFFLEHVGHGVLVYVAEAGLIVALLTHIINGIQVALFDKGAARPKGYQRTGNAGGPSRKSVFSQYMIVSGSMLLIFLIVHIATLKFGLGTTAGKVNIGDQEFRDLYGLVVDYFANPAWVAFYVFIMCMLMFHLKHGVWSAFQSLGLINSRIYPGLVTGSVVFAILLALGFIALPVSIYALHDQFMRPQGGIF